jgi:uncharacterized protein (DUF1697 family)
VPAYVALLRGINVSGHRQMKMRDVNAMCEELGFTEVATYLQSGNVVFEGRSTPTAKLEQQIHEAIRERWGHDVAVLVRTATEWAGVVEYHPFVDRTDDPTKLHVTFLQGAPSRAAVAALDVDAGAEEYEVHGREVYLHCPHGYGRAKLVNPYWERALGTVATTRNWKTVGALRDLLGG